MINFSEENATVSYINKQRRTNHTDYQNCLFAYFLSQQEPKKVIQALTDSSWIEAMQEELLQFKLQKVWTLVDLPKGKRAIGTKWVYRNKKDERGIVVRNKARLVAQGYTQEEGIDYDEVFAPVARIEAIRLFLAYASFMGFIVYQMDVKSAFLYGTIEEEVYVCQPPSFEDPQFPDKVYKVEKALYGLHQAPRAWYETLSTYLLENGFRRGTIDKTLFIKKDRGDILLVQVYVDDIIFGSTKKSLCDEFEQIMHKRFQMSSMGELTFFLGLQVQQKGDGIFISQDKYVADILKKFDFVTMKTTSTPIESNKALIMDEEAEDVDRIFRYLKGQPKLGLWYPRDSPLDLESFSDSDYTGASLDNRGEIPTRGFNSLSKGLISWQCKKQTIVANSTTEAEYVAAANCCGQVLWIQNQMLDYGFNFMNTKIHIDNESTICIVKNPVFHSKTKHIEIRHHFIRDSYEKRLIQVIKIHTDHNVADLLTKAFDVSSDEFGVKTGSCKVNAARQDLVLLGEISTAGLPLLLLVTVGDNTAEGPEVISVFSATNELLQIPHQSPLKQLLIDRLDHDAGPFSVQVTPSSFWQVIHPQVVSNIMKNPSNRCECVVTEPVKFIGAHQPISLELILIENTLRVFVCSVWCQFGDVRSKSLGLSDVKFFLIAFDSQLKVFHPLKNNNTPGEHSQCYIQIKSWEVAFLECANDGSSHLRPDISSKIALTIPLQSLFTWVNA
ncbi:putative ribonuclease H-like domain-containing protein [Tanacetum coccineum]|uniref:Ribonuclease H-like domain-containing protein n=1 Tax=Tanacetum coccineum TaxID=301880 RepID=A0ABQ4X246_9ASTR